MSSGTSTSSLQPWQFFVLAALASATVAIFLVQARGLTAVLLLTVLMAAAALVGLAALRTIRPLVSPHEDRATIGERTLGALEREKALTLRTIKELEFDRAMGKISVEDFSEMSARLRARAARLIHQLDARTGYRERVERDLASRLGTSVATAATPESRAGLSSQDADQVRVVFRACGSCATKNDGDARFCKGCGAKL